MLTDRPAVEADGLRISAARAGRPNDDDGFDDPDGDRRGSTGPARTSSNGGESRGDSKRGARGARGRKRATPDGWPTTALSSAATRPETDPPSAARLKVRRQRRRRRRTLIACTFVTTVCTFVAGVGYVYVHNRLAQIRRVDLASLAGDSPGAVMNVLLVGSDGRTEDKEPGQRSDTIMILHVDPRQQQAAIVSVPPTLLIPIAGTANVDRVETAFTLGGADQLVATIQEGLGVTINHYIQVDLEGLKDIVDAVGGVTQYVPYPVRDSVTGLGLDRGGCVELDGDQSLSWVRSRQIEFLVNGAWQPDVRGDLGRIERQQDLIRSVMKEALSSGITNPIRSNRLIGVGARHITFDSGLSTRDLTVLRRRFSSPEPDKVAPSILPTAPADLQGKSVQLLQLAPAQPILEVLRGGSPAADTPTTVTTPAATIGTPSAGVKASDVKVRVLNGVGTPGAAAKAATSLTSVGFTVADKGDAASISAKTTIMYAAGQLAKAQLLQGSLLTPAVLREDVTLKAVDVNLVLGADYTGVKSGISSGTSSASTTVVRSTTPTSAASTTTVVAQANLAPAPSTVPAPRC